MFFGIRLATRKNCPRVFPENPVLWLFDVGERGSKVMQNALNAVRFLTIAGAWSPDLSTRGALGKGALYFPLIGFLLGATLALVSRILEPHLESEILGVALIAILALLSGGTHLQGIHNIFDRVSVNGRHSEPVSVRSTGRSASVAGFLAVLMIVLFKIRSVEVSGELRNVGLLLAPGLARWTLVIFLYESGELLDLNGGAIRNVSAWHLLFTSILTIAVTIYFVGAIGLWIGLFLSFIPLVYRLCLVWSRRALTQDDCGALTEISETFAFILFASF